MSSSHICLFHDVHYSSIVQHAFNLLRKSVIKDKCDLNKLGKNAVCTCEPSSVDQVATAVLTDSDREQLLQKIRSNFSQLGQSSAALEEVLGTKKIRECANQMGVDKLCQFMCDISDRALESKKRSTEVGAVPVGPQRIRRSIELPLRLDQLGHLMGRHGVHFRDIMSQTNTSIHADNALYSESPYDQSPVFRLDSLSPLAHVQVTITGQSVETVESAIRALQEKTEQVKKNLAEYSSASNESST